jgi:hypothetical protein
MQILLLWLYNVECCSFVLIIAWDIFAKKLTIEELPLDWALAGQAT